MNDWYFHVLDVAHGAVMAVLLYFVFRLLIFRKEGVIRLRYLAAGILILALLQIFNLPGQDEAGVSLGWSEYISLLIDGVSLLFSLAVLWILYRNRYIYPKHVVRIAGVSLLTVIACYIFSACFGFEEWTYVVYLLVATIGWVAFCLTIEKIPETTVRSKQNADNDTYAAFVQQLDEVMHYDNMFCREDLTRDQVCRAMMTNRTTFSAKLKQASGKTFSEYLRDMRLEEAARLLRETDIPVDQIAFQVGLQSPSGFHRNFLLSYGMTPNRYRLTESNRKE